MHFGLGPIGAAIAKQVAARPGFKIVGGIDIDPAKVGRDLGDVVGLPRRLGVEGLGRRGQGAQGREARRRRALHELVDQDGACRRSRRSSRRRRRSSRRPRSCRIPATRTSGRRGRSTRGRRRRRSRVLGTGVNPGLRDGRAADRADGGVRARRSRRRQPRSGRAHPPAAVPAEDRRRPDDRAVPAEGGRRQRAARRASPNRSR